jgi:hypothetical protein
MLAPVLHESFLSDAFAGREGQTPPFKGRAHAALALAKNTLFIRTRYLKVPSQEGTSRGSFWVTTGGRQTAGF